MEKRKLLLVAISAGIFLVIAIGAAIVFTPQETTITSTAAVVYPAPGGAAINVTPPAWQAPPVPPPVDPVELVRVPVDGLGLQPPPPAIQPGEFAITEQVVPRVITVPRPTAAAVPDAPPPPPARAVEPAPVAARPAPPAAAPARPAPPAPRPAAPAPRPAAPVSVQNDYWVQAGSFSTIVNAEKARDALAHMGITSIIENRTVGDSNWFRVRVGPYPSQDEADYWRYLIVSIAGFEQSMVWQTARR